MVRKVCLDGRGRHPESTWDDPLAVEQLKKLWADGLSGSQIAYRIGNGLTRCAILGKIHRMKLSRLSPERSKIKRTQARPLKKRPQYATLVRMGIIPDPHTYDRLVIALADADRPTIAFADVGETQCRWIIGHDRPARCCGDAAVVGKPYCMSHLSRASAAPLVTIRKSEKAVDHAPA